MATSMTTSYKPSFGPPPPKRKRRNNLRILRALADANAPADLLYELVPRPSFNVFMDNCLNTIKLIPGRDGKNAILKGWIDAIKKHDELVIKVEEKMDVAEAKRAIYIEKQRVYENHLVAWNALYNADPDSYQAYVNDFKPRFQAVEDIKVYLEEIKDIDDREKAAKDHHKYLAVMSRCEKLIPFEKLVNELKEAYDVATRESVDADTDLQQILALERKAASEISEDHVIAAELDKNPAEIFPTIRPGYLVSRINGVAVEDKSYDTIMSILYDAAPPHNIEFRRYDYIQNFTTNKWESFQELRSMGRWAPDPRHERITFVEACRRGDIGTVKAKLIAGADVNWVDDTESSGMHHAAAQGHIELMKFLLDNKGLIDARNKNLETPLIVATKRGMVKSVTWLIENRATVNTLDRHRRPALVHAIRAKSLELIKVFLDRTIMLNKGDYQWGWTPVHYAASVGNNEILKLILDRKGCKYKLSKNGRTPEQVAQHCHQLESAALLKELVFRDPAQRIVWNDAGGAGGDDYVSGAKGGGKGKEIWLGSMEAASPSFATSIGFDAFLLLHDHGTEDPNVQWIEQEDNLHCYSSVFKISEEDKTDRSWRELLIRLRPMTEFLQECITIGPNSKILICCTNGVSTAPALLIAFLLLKRRVRVQESLAHIRGIRRQVHLSLSMWKGLEALEGGFDRAKLQSLDYRVKRCQLFDLATG